MDSLLILYSYQKKKKFNLDIFFISFQKSISIILKTVLLDFCIFSCIISYFVYLLQIYLFCILFRILFRILSVFVCFSHTYSDTNVLPVFVVYFCLLDNVLYLSSIYPNFSYIYYHILHIECFFYNRSTGFIPICM